MGRPLATVGASFMPYSGTIVPTRSPLGIFGDGRLRAACRSNAFAASPRRFARRWRKAVASIAFSRATAPPARPAAHPGAFVTAEERLWLTADRSELVPDGDERAAFLFSVAGQQILREEAELFGLFAEPEAEPH